MDLRNAVYKTERSVLCVRIFTILLRVCINLQE